MAKKEKKLWIDMCAGSELKDTQGETLSVEGADIHDLEVGKGRLNDNHGKGFFNSLGRVTEAKKILKAEDCDNERHEYYWNKIKAPYVYAKGYLYSDEDHSNAKAAAAILRNIHREDAPLAMKASVEGGVISRGISDSTRLARTKIHSVALTFTPANNATLVEPLNLDKSSSNWEADKQLIKSVMHLAETDVPSFRHIERHASANSIHDNILKIQELSKSLGINIEIKESDPDVIMKQAVMHKISDNISKINNLVKAVTSPGKVAMAAKQQKENKIKAEDKFQQKIRQMQSSAATVPDKPKDLDVSSKDITRVKSAAKIKSQNVVKQHASRAMRDPAHLDNMHSDLVGRGIHPDKAKAIIGKVKSHMVKTDDIDEVEKGDIASTAKNLILTGALGMAAHHIGEDPGKEADKQVKPKQQAERTVASKDKKIKPEKFKKSLIKALTAGYGGSGSPTNLSGGGVFQPESLEDGRKSDTSDGFTYITCDNCGHEQVYMSHQVKCRKCKQNFSLSKLKNHM